ncbi:Alpha-1,3-mannosyltransferase-like protein [Coemansia sp. RSA 2618]|nr:Alpha-1,3-mannosyltransferase-like protein [Coemansia sp. RSA 2618]
MQPLNIAIVHPDLGIGGAERLVVDTALALQQRGHRVHIYTLHHSPAHSFAETRDGTLDVRVVTSWFPRTLFGRMRILCATLQAQSLAQGVANAHTQYDAIFADIASAPIPLLKYANAHILFYCHFPDKLLAPRATLWQRVYRAPFDVLEQMTTGEADMVAVNSRFTQETFRAAFPRLPLPRVVHPALNCAAYDAAPVDGADIRALRTPRTVVLSVSRFERKKSVALAIDALACMGDKGVCLVVAGGWDPRVRENSEHLRELDAHARALGLATRTVAPRGSPPEVLALLPPGAERVPTFADDSAEPPAPADVLFVPSFTENQRAHLLSVARCVVYTPANEHLGIVPLEAMYMRVPVVAADSGGPRETVVHGSTGYLCEHSADAFAAAITRVLRAEDSAWRAMGAAGRARVLEHFSLGAYALKLEGLFQIMFESPTHVSSVLGILMTLFIVCLSGSLFLAATYL